MISMQDALILCFEIIFLGISTGIAVFVITNAYHNAKFTAFRSHIVHVNKLVKKGEIPKEVPPQQNHHIN